MVHSNHNRSDPHAGRQPSTSGPLSHRDAALRFQYWIAHLLVGRLASVWAILRVDTFDLALWCLNDKIHSNPNRARLYCYFPTSNFRTPSLSRLHRFLDTILSLVDRIDAPVLSRIEVLS